LALTRYSCDHQLEPSRLQHRQVARPFAFQADISASDANDFLRTTIEESPYTTAAIALGIGFLIGRFGRRADH
jgi:ElaB/YqjD/DUF883 family membrane-anchored ribosome-binding protein